MLEKARASFANNRSIYLDPGESSKYTYAFEQGSGEDLSKAIPHEGSVDMLIAGTYGLATPRQLYQLMLSKLRQHIGLTGVKFGLRRAGYCERMVQQRSG
jgi:hypothetical protein